MATIKSYTDIEQSKKLAEILPIESADMYYISGDEYDICFGNGVYEEIADWLSDGTPRSADIPCWSLAALLGVIPKKINFGYENDSTFVLKPLTNGKYLADYYEISYVKDNPIDACYELILKLNELNLL